MQNIIQQEIPEHVRKAAEEEFLQKAAQVRENYLAALKREKNAVNGTKAEVENITQKDAPSLKAIHGDERGTSAHNFQYLNNFGNGYGATDDHMSLEAVKAKAIYEHTVTSRPDLFPEGTKIVNGINYALSTINSKNLQSAAYVIGSTTESAAHSNVQNLNFFNSKDHVSYVENSNGEGLSATIDTLTKIKQGVIMATYHDGLKKAQKNIDTIIDTNLAWFDNFATLTAAGNPNTDMLAKGFSDTGLTIADQNEMRVAYEKRPLFFWQQEYKYDVWKVEKAKTQGFDLIAQQDMLFKKFYEQCIHRAMLIGVPGTGLEGVLTLSGANVNQVDIVKYISAMTDAECNTLISTLPGLFLGYTGYWTPSEDDQIVFKIAPEDYAGLGITASANFNIGMTRRDALVNGLASGFGVKPENIHLVSDIHCSKAYNGLNKNIYTMYVKNPDVLCHYEAIPFTSTGYFSENGVEYKGRNYAQLNGVVSFKPKMVVRFEFS